MMLMRGRTCYRIVMGPVVLRRGAVVSAVVVGMSGLRLAGVVLICVVVMVAMRGSGRSFELLVEEACRSHLHEERSRGSRTGSVALHWMSRVRLVVN